MSREIIAVYQDCVLCGTKGKQKIADCAKQGVTIRKVGFTTEEGRELIHRAVFDHKIGTMPFYVEGDQFSASLDSLINSSPKPLKSAKKLQKKVVLEKKTKITERKVESNGTLAAN